MNKISKLLTILFLFILCTSTSFAGESNTSSLDGAVIDSQTGEPLAGVMIRIKNIDKVFYSDVNGVFHIEGLKSNAQYSVEVSYPSYEDVLISNVQLSERTQSLTVTLVSE